MGFSLDITLATETKFGAVPDRGRNTPTSYFVHTELNGSLPNNNDILNNKERLNGLKGSTTMQNIESLLKYQSRIYNVQRNSDVNPRGMKIIWNNKLFP